MTPLILILSLFIVGILVYRFWEPFVNPPKRETPEGTATLYFFYTDWCGHSKKAMPEWEKLEKSSGYFGKTHVSFVAVDAEADQATATRYEVEAYPTVLLETRDGIIPYGKRVTTQGLKDFLTAQFGKEQTGL